jgi:hypothetical protein
MELIFYSAQQISAMTGMSVDWIWKQARLGKIQHHKLGSKYRFTAGDLSALVAQSAVSPTVLENDSIPERWQR